MTSRSRIFYFNSSRPFTVIAHRGDSFSAPENTMPAFYYAHIAGVQDIEFDITLTSDLQFICIHDETLDRTTSGSGLCRNHTLIQLSTLDAGQWFSSLFRNTRIPTLDEILLWGKPYKINFNIEIKPEAFSSFSKNHLLLQLGESIQLHSMQSQVLISSFSREALQAIRQAYPQLPCAFLIDSPTQSTDEIIRLLIELDSQGLHLNSRSVTQEIIDACFDSKKWLAVYTVDDLDTAKRLNEMGVSAIFTNHPAQLLTHFHQ